MNIKSEIREELWDVVSKSYESKIYQNAILDAIHLLSDLLRERANVDGDGASLVGQALGGDTPRLRINKLQTETEKNEQRGLEQILRGMYLGIRNPRSHEQYQDSQEAADAIILFINHIIGIISEAKEPFTLQEWCNRVFDVDFVASNRYAELLAAEVPPKKYSEALIMLYRNKASGDGDKLAYIFRALIELAGEENIEDFLGVVSEELRTTSDDANVRITIQILPHHLWPRINEVARIRIENKLVNSIRDGEYLPEPDRCKSGALGTWASRILKHFTLRDEVYYALHSKLRGKVNEQNYVAQYFLEKLADTLQGLSADCAESRKRSYVKAILGAASNREGSTLLRTSLLWGPSYFDEWESIFREEVDSFKHLDPEFFQSVIDKDIPF
jgi:uncharacterized protein (TIGR02391 family)